MQKTGYYGIQPVCDVKMHVLNGTDAVVVVFFLTSESGDGGVIDHHPAGVTPIPFFRRFRKKSQNLPPIATAKDFPAPLLLQSSPSARCLNL